jgi:predicted metal-dependent HD superfamily phosphohydrolase
VNRDRVRLRYAEPHRRYHTTEHLDEVLAHVATLSDLATDAGAVELAALFHDAVYDPTDPPGSSEAASAELAREELGDDPRLDEVARLVLLTAGHDVEPGDANGAVLVDADLAILGAPTDRYRRYARDVRAEYAHVDAVAWGAGRSAVLERFLARPRLYATDRFHELLDGAARRNLAEELAALRGGEPLP